MIFNQNIIDKGIDNTTTTISVSTGYSSWTIDTNKNYILCSSATTRGDFKYRVDKINKGNLIAVSNNGYAIDVTLSGTTLSAKCSSTGPLTQSYYIGFLITL